MKKRRTFYTVCKTFAQKELRRMHDTGDYSVSDLAEVFTFSRPTV